MAGILKNHQRIHYADGVSEEEAKLIAQKFMIDSIYTGPMDLYHPVVDQSPAAQEYRNFWFVIFSSLSKGDKALRQLVVIDKRTGGVIRSVDVAGRVYENFDWIFQ